jgi:hypothetical protein
MGLRETAEKLAAEKAELDAKFADLAARTAKELSTDSKWKSGVHEYSFDQYPGRGVLRKNCYRFAEFFFDNDKICILTKDLPQSLDEAALQALNRALELFKQEQ